MVAFAVNTQNGHDTDNPVYWDGDGLYGMLSRRAAPYKSKKKKEPKLPKNTSSLRRHNGRLSYLFGDGTNLTSWTLFVDGTNHLMFLSSSCYWSMAVRGCYSFVASEYR